jgi:hypothetical protein
MLTIGGLSQSQALDILGISRQTLFRFRRDPSWPGDNADFDMIRMFVSLRHKNSGRKPKEPAHGSAGNNGYGSAGASPSKGNNGYGSAGASPSKGNNGYGSAGANGNSEDALESVLNAPNEAAELAAALGLDQEMKMVLIEKYKTAISAYQRRVIDEHKAALVTRMERALDRIYDAVAALELPPAQIENIRAAIRSAQSETQGDPGAYQPVFL